MSIKHITVIGGGTMGNGIAYVFALNNFKVDLIEQSSTQLEKAMSMIKNNLDRQLKKEIISGEQAKVAMKNINTIVGIQSIGFDTDVVIEAIFEDFEAKKNIFSEIDKLVKPEAIFATNTSSISITKLASVSRAKNFIGMHFMNPVPMMQLVEIICGYETSAKTLASIKQLVVQIGKQPVEVNDSPGFISNRILMPMINEAIFALYEGVANAEDIDKVMKLGMNHPMGTLALADFIGLDVCLAIMEVLYEGFSDSKYRPCPLLRKMVNAKKLGKKTGEGFYKYE